MVARREESGFNAREHEPAGYRLRSAVKITSTPDPLTGDKKYYIKTNETGEVFELGEEEYFFCVRLDGRVSFAEFQRAFEAHFGARLTYEKFKSFAEQLIEMRVLEKAGGDAFSAAASALIEDILEPDDPDPRATPFRRTLLDPGKLFGALSKLGPLDRAMSWALWPLVIFAFAIWAHQSAAVFSDFAGVARNFSFLLYVPVSLFTVNLASRLAQGVAAYREGAAVRSLGVIFFFGVIPRFYVDQNAIMALDDDARRRVYSAPLKMRLLICALAMILWAALRERGGFVPEASLIVGHIAVAAFFLTAIPLLPDDGYHWMTALLHQPTLRDRSLRYLQMRLSGRPAPADMTAADRVCALLFAAASVLFLATLLILVVSIAAMGLERSLGGAGVAILIGVLALTVAWFLASRRAAARVRETLRTNFKASHATPSAGAARLRGPDATGAVIPLQPQRPNPVRVSALPLRAAPLRKNWPRFAWLGAALAFILLLLLPYQYKPGGDFQILPNHRYQVNARIDGEIAEVFVKEGQWVEKDQPLVRIANWQIERNLSAAQAELDRSKAVLARLVEGAKREEIALAKSQVDSAASRLTFKRAEMERQQDLLKEGITTRRVVELRESEYQSAVSDWKVAKANLAVVKSSSTKAEIETASAEVRRFESEVAFRKEDLARTLVTAPTAGNIVTANVDLKAGAFLKIGDLLAEIEDNRVARIEIQLAQSDVRFIKVGDRVQVKPWGYSNQTLYGAVIALAPNADQTQLGRYVRVLSEMPNETQTLRSNMSGFAKIEGETMQVWRAYLLFFIRFVEVEVWSWIP